jgi:hypothetical protein
MAIEDKEIDAIVFVGDLTSGRPKIKEQEDGLRHCVEYITANITQPLLKGRSRKNTIFVPGNQDVDRTKCPSNGDFEPKFRIYMNCLSSYGFKNISVLSASRIDITHAGGGAASIFGINTSLGCGEFYNFPDAVKRNLVDALATTLDPNKHDEIENLVERFIDLTERLDAPLIEASVLRDLDGNIHQLMEANPIAIPIVVGHHNLLPQVIPRVAPFSELMNSGQLRSFLTGKQRPICYLHGHIHADTIELIFDHNDPDGGVVSISAPLFIDGYNLLEFHFDRSANPLGVAIIPFRQERTGKFKKLPPRRVPFLLGRHRLSSISAHARELFSKLFTSNQTYFFSDVEVAFPQLTSLQLADAAMELEWIGVVEISHRERPSAQWNIRSAV